MHKTQKNWSKLSAELREVLFCCKLNPSSLSREAGIKYHAARRLLKGRLEKSSAPAIKLCVHFGIELYENAKMHADDPLAKLTHVINEVWDGSEDHAELLAKLIKSTKNYSINRNNI